MQEALDVIEGEGDFDLLVLDENMPDSGIFLQKIRALKIPTVVAWRARRAPGSCARWCRSATEEREGIKKKKR